jgi:membrane protein DedA with SNARE-associated domain
VEELLVHFGPLAVLVCAAIEYDGSLILAGVVVHLGFIAFPTAVAAGGVGALLGDSVLFALGQRGNATVRGWSAYARVESFVEKLTTRCGPWEIVLARFVYGTRVVSMLFWGVRGLSWLTFAGLDLLGGLLGALVLVALGFALSQSASVLLGEVDRVERRLLGCAIVAAVVVIGFNALTRRWRGVWSPGGPRERTGDGHPAVDPFLRPRSARHDAGRPEE